MVAYSAASLGATVHLHYCMDKLVEWGMARNEGNMCGHKGVMKGMDNEKCCKHQYRQLKVENHYKDAVSVIDHNKFTTVANLGFPYQITINPTSIPVRNAYEIQDHRAKPNNKIYILNCVYRI